MFSQKKRRRRRSEMRLGAQAIKYQTTAAKSALSMAPFVDFWQARGVKFSGLLALGGLIWVIYFLFTSSSFFVYGAEIRGNVAVSAREIYAASQIDSQSIFWISPAQVERSIEALPNIKSASVMVKLPAQVTIEVAERRPQLLWQSGDTVWWVDEEGTVVPPKAEMEDMLKIIDDDRQPLEVGYQIDSSLIKGAQTLRILAPDVRVVRHARATGLMVATPEGWPVYLGDGVDIKAKLMVLSALLPQLRENERPPAYIDLRDPLQPVYRIVPEVRIEPPPLRQPVPVRPTVPPPYRQNRP
ncbi:MAG: FtsQ-type POTRA domain-containing protein [Anaerolineales bacterium]|nr:FtsQ-type POTRA domain-containing protein [Anaerolineales bacterium]